MKYYLVASSTCCMVGIEQCTVFIVGRAQRAAFEKQYADYILMVARSREALPPARFRLYQ
ncbi:hypothetical protein D3H65_28290 [Paraflavitalea soli]|uniref:Uncharacterized protein n=1 Tax=Paraflavitalea soli TaxID=2315862 RepID=A0A3B7MSW2_9BACT|nr:hypothetical protein [Paraflavitalea soli]AXY77644.1 hypothetical protein D3H65_28290 [Paraflavitalea soli]